MAKLKGKSKKAAGAAAAATAGSANVKEASGDDTLVASPAPSSAPLEEICKEAEAENAAVLDDKSDGAVDSNKEEETEPEEIEDEGVEEETEKGLDDKLEEETEEGLDDKLEEEDEEGLDDKLEEEADDVEEEKDGLDDSSEEDSDDDEEVDDESDEGDELEEDAEEENAVVAPAGTDVIPEGGNMVDNNGKVEGEMKVEKEKDDKKDDAKGEDTPKKKLEIMKWGKKETASASVAAAAVSDDADETLGNAVKQRATALEGLKLVYGMGMIFMCNARTKKDCFRYNVLGLPASKKDMVAKIYKGMRLFLYDRDLKVMYGVYKAASPGGYNIEPEAFKSNKAKAFMFETPYPAQVRFKVIKDCPPLPEATFKAAIEENYYQEDKFDCQLSPEQVKKLCKLFQKEGKNPKTKTSSELITAEPVPPRPARGRGKNYWKSFREGPELPRPARGRGKYWKSIREEPEGPPRPARGRGKPWKSIGEEPEEEPPRPARGRGKSWKAFRGKSSAQGHPKNRKAVQAAPEPTTSAPGRKRAREVTRAEPEQAPARGRKKSRHERGRGKFRHERGRRDDSTSSSEEEHHGHHASEGYPSPRGGGDRSYAKRREAYPSPPPPGSFALPPPPPLPAYAYGRLRGDEYYYRRDPPPPPHQLLNPMDYGRELPRDYQRAMALEARPYSGMYREPVPYNMPSASYAAPPPAYPPPAARLAPSGYAPHAASLAPSAYAPPAPSVGPTTGFPPSAAGAGPTTGFPPSSSLYFRY